MARPTRKPDTTLVVQQLNAARYALGHRGRPLSKIPTGQRWSNYHCPLSVAIGELAIDGNYAYLNGTGALKLAAAWNRRGMRYDDNEREVPLNEQLWAVPLPDELRRFSKAFDEGKLPEYAVQQQASNG